MKIADFINKLESQFPESEFYNVDALKGRVYGVPKFKGSKYLFCARKGEVESETTFEDSDYTAVDQLYSVVFYNKESKKIETESGIVCYIKHSSFKRNVPHTFFDEVYAADINRSMTSIFNPIARFDGSYYFGRFSLDRAENYIGKSLSEFAKSYCNKNEIAYLFGLGSYISNVEVEFIRDLDTKKSCFDYIHIECGLSGFSEVSNKTKIGFFKNYYNRVMNMIMKAVTVKAEWNQFDIPVNCLKVTDFILTKDSRLVVNLGLKNI